MTNSKVQSIAVLALIVFLAAISATTVQAAGKIGKLFIKTGSPEPGGQQFVDPGLEDSAKDIKRRAGSFVVVDDEASADFMMVIVSRDDTPVSGQPTAKRVTVNLSIRDGASWKSGVKISKVTPTWGLSAAHVIEDAQKWIRKNAKK